VGVLPGGGRLAAGRRGIFDGIPLQIKHVYVLIDRPGFMFNPTNCNPMKITGAVVGGRGAPREYRCSFRAVGCAGLGFGAGAQRLDRG
jgi:hypothetical protein